MKMDHRHMYDGLRLRKGCRQPTHNAIAQPQVMWSN